MKSDFPGSLSGPNPTEPLVLTVSKLNRICRFMLNEALGSTWVEGEISNFTAAASGHLYFTLKDSEAQVRCAMFKPQARTLGRQPRNGDHVLLRAQVSIYEPRGDFQLIVESLEEAGAGLLARDFERLKLKLANEGLFDAIHKKPIPAMPQAVGVVTSPTGAALQDILTVLRRRFPAMEVVVIPSKVQGTGAPAEIIRAIRLANQAKCCDVLIVGRGGGSTEDLWPFNDEGVARAIFASEIPIISAVGHEIDFTISDFVADSRAPTPSAAAETVSPDSRELLISIARLSARLQERMEGQLEGSRQRLRLLAREVEAHHPARRLQTQAQRLDDLSGRMSRCMVTTLTRSEGRIAALDNRLGRLRLDQRINLLEARYRGAAKNLEYLVRRQLQQLNQQLAGSIQQLQAVSPLATLARGYSITTDFRTGKVIMQCETIQTGQQIKTRLGDGILVSTVDAITPESG